jgi:hypothetical protein
MGRGNGGGRGVGSRERSGRNIEVVRGEGGDVGMDLVFADCGTFFAYSYNLFVIVKENSYKKKAIKGIGKVFTLLHSSDKPEQNNRSAYTSMGGQAGTGRRTAAFRHLYIFTLYLLSTYISKIKVFFFREN